MKKTRLFLDDYLVIYYTGKLYFLVRFIMDEMGNYVLEVEHIKDHTQQKSFSESIVGFTIIRQGETFTYRSTNIFSFESVYPRDTKAYAMLKIFWVRR